jgi:O-antigen/teichoic acid export membrane protein
MNETVAVKVAAVPITMSAFTFLGYSLDTWVSVLGILVSIVVLIDYGWKWVRRLKTPIYSTEEVAVLKTLDTDNQ